MRALAIVVATALAACLDASDALHVPLLCKYNQESHAVAGALVGLAVDASLQAASPLQPVARELLGVGAALAIGYGKEHLVDHHAHDREVPAWGAGAAVACLSFEWRF